MALVGLDLTSRQSYALQLRITSKLYLLASYVSMATLPSAKGHKLASGLRNAKTVNYPHNYYSRVFVWISSFLTDNGNAIIICILIGKEKKLLVVVDSFDRLLLSCKHTHMHTHTHTHACTCTHTCTHTHTHAHTHAYT